MLNDVWQYLRAGAIAIVGSAVLFTIFRASAEGLPANHLKELGLAALGAVLLSAVAVTLHNWRLRQKAVRADKKRQIWLLP